MGKKFHSIIRWLDLSLDRLLTFSPRYIVVRCLSYENKLEGREGWRLESRACEVGETKRVGEGKDRTFRIHELAQRSL